MIPIRPEFSVQHNDSFSADFDWHSLADPATTTAIYMPTRRLAATVERAIDEGLDPHTLSDAVAGATRPDQSVIAARIVDLPVRLAAAALRGPILVMIGRLLASQINACEGQLASASADTSMGAISGTPLSCTP